MVRVQLWPAIPSGVMEVDCISGSGEGWVDVPGAVGGVGRQGRGRM